MTRCVQIDVSASRCERWPNALLLEPADGLVPILFALLSRVADLLRQMATDRSRVMADLLVSRFRLCHRCLAVARRFTGSFTVVRRYRGGERAAEQPTNENGQKYLGPSHGPGHTSPAHRDTSWPESRLGFDSPKSEQFFLF